MRRKRTCRMLLNTLALSKSELLFYSGKGLSNLGKKLKYKENKKKSRRWRWRIGGLPLKSIYNIRWKARETSFESFWPIVRLSMCKNTGRRLESFPTKY
jgi:hypothetical protein